MQLQKIWETSGGSTDPGHISTSEHQTDCQHGKAEEHTSPQEEVCGEPSEECSVSELEDCQSSTPLKGDQLFHSPLPAIARFAASALAPFRLYVSQA